METLHMVRIRSPLNAHEDTLVSLSSRRGLTFELIFFPHVRMTSSRYDNNKSGQKYFSPFPQGFNKDQIRAFNFALLESFYCHISA